MLLLLVEDASHWWLTVPAVIIIGREITISALREWMASVGSRAKVAVSYLGKIKTTLQIGALSLLLYKYPVAQLPVYEIGVAALYIAAAITIWSMVDYLMAAFVTADKVSTKEPR